LTATLLLLLSTASSIAVMMETLVAAIEYCLNNVLVFFGIKYQDGIE